MFLKASCLQLQGLSLKLLNEDLLLTTDLLRFLECIKQLSVLDFEAFVFVRHLFLLWGLSLGLMKRLYLSL